MNLRSFLQLVAMIIIVIVREASLKKWMFSIRRCPNYPPDNGGDDDRDGGDDYSDMPAATIPPSVWQSANLQILCQPPQHWVGNKDKGSLV